ncbi:MAG: hypothetical protein GKR88_00080 [Flavobacteriaceae bacterium]|nr:MAG: hypothetical protein GKR88_00080 [Flavobacteriaceae bacterium]
MKVKIIDIQKGFNKIFDHIKDSGIEEVEIQKDFYWNIPEEERYRLEKEPANLDMGQLSEDWDNLLRIINNENDPIAYALVWLSSIGRYVGEKIVS